MLVSHQRSKLGKDQQKKSSPSSGTFSLKTSHSQPVVAPAVLISEEPEVQESDIWIQKRREPGAEPLNFYV